jgi:hypothetical protein
LYGYNVDEVDCGGVTWKDDGKSGNVSSIRTNNRYVRAPECVSLPCTVEGGVYFRPNTQDSLSATQGLRKRLVHERPPIDPKTLEDFKIFVTDWLQHNMTPLRVDEIPEFEEWLEQVNHPEWRKKEYRNAKEQWDSGEVKKHKLFTKKCFVKREFYDAAKYHRVIHSPTDYEKVLQGRFISAMEEKLFSRPEFIKKIPRADWPAFIRDNVAFPGMHVFGSDYSSFEANFVAAIQQTCELLFACYMLAAVLSEEGVENILAGYKRKVLDSKLFVAWIVGRRSSGQMSTSLFNGFSNLMFNLFVLKQKCGATVVRCVVEGDDGLFCHNGSRKPTPEDYLKLGLTIKIVDVEYWYHASFCGVVTHPDVLDTLCNPWKSVLTCSWAGHNYLRASDRTLTNLAQVKGLSYLAQYPGCPVVQSVGVWMLRTTGFDPERLEDLLDWYKEQVGVTWWDAQIVAEIRKSSLQARSVDIRSRQIVEEVFGVSIDTQLFLENLFDEDTTGHIQLDPSVTPAVYRAQWNDYVQFRVKNDEDLCVFHHAPEAQFPNNLSPFVRGDFETCDLKVRSHVSV